ncbi:MAG: hypothetical protein AAF771_01145 [Pseudomonadota bacterium]
MSDYDYRPSHERGARAMDYSRDPDNGGGLWAVIGLVAVLALLGLIIFGAATGTPDGGTTGAGTGAETAPATAVPTEGTGQ